MSDLKIGMPDFAKDALSNINLKANMNGLQAVANNVSGTNKPDKKATEDAARQFESMLIQQMLKSMWQTVPNEGIFKVSREEELYRDMLNQAYAEEMSKGQGIGIKGLVEGEMDKKKDIRSE
jgi:Rod binding domain-containing protein